MNLLFHDLQHFHGAVLDTDAAGDALGNRIFLLVNHDLHGAGLDTLAAADTVLLVDHVNTGLGVLGDGTVLTGLHALTALNADHGLCTAVLTGNDLDAGVIGMKFLIECFGAGTDTFQTSHTFHIFLHSELLHN